MKWDFHSGLLNESFWNKNKIYHYCWIAIVITWLPPIFLSLVEGTFFSDTNKHGILNAFLFHIRFLITIPLLIVSEFYATKIILQKLKFIEFSNLLKEEDKGNLESCVHKTMTLANSRWLHFFLLLFVIGFRFYEKQEYELLCKSWLIKDCSGHTLKWTMAGWWATWISNIIFLFVLLRNFWLVIVWAYLIRKISKLSLQLSAIHPDKFGGVGFLCELPFPFMFTTIAFSTIVASGIAVRMLRASKDLEIYYPVFFALGALIIFVHLFPFFSLIPSLIECKLHQRTKYSSLVLLHHSYFYKKWIEGDKIDETILGSPDPSSAADSNTYFDAAIKMKVIPINIKSLLIVFIISMSPLMAVFFIKYPVKEVFNYLFKMLFNSGIV